MGTVTSLSNGNLVHFGDSRSSVSFILVTVTLYNYTTTVTTEIITTTTIYHFWKTYNVLFFSEFTQKICI